MTKQPDDFAKQFNELETVTAWFESDQINLDEGLVKFERGMELVSALKKQLSEIENRVEIIKQKFDSQQPELVEEPAPSTEAKTDLFS